MRRTEPLDTPYIRPRPPHPPSPPRSRPCCGRLENAKSTAEPWHPHHCQRRGEECSARLAMTNCRPHQRSTCLPSSHGCPPYRWTYRNCSHSTPSQTASEPAGAYWNRRPIHRHPIHRASSRYLANDWHRPRGVNGRCRHHGYGHRHRTNAHPPFSNVALAYFHGTAIHQWRLRPLRAKSSGRWSPAVPVPCTPDFAQVRLPAVPVPIPVASALAYASLASTRDFCSSIFFA